MKTLALLLAGMIWTFAYLPMQAQTTTTVTTTTTTNPSSAQNAVNIAKDGVDASLRDRVVSVYGVGTPAAIQTWWVIFYDPSVASHGRAVKVENGQVTRTYEANGGVTYSNALTFPRSQVSGEAPALAAAQNYAAQHAVAYDQVRALLRMTTTGQDFRWRVQLLNGTKSKGFVFANATDGAFVTYLPPAAVSAKSSHSGTGGVAGDVEHAANDVKNTFLGIGGDLQEFFTGERTVDR